MRQKLCLALVVLLMCCPAFADPILSFELSSSNVTVGNTFSVNINVTDASDLYAFGFDLGFDQSALAAQSVVEGSFLSNEGTTFFIPGAINNAAGSIAFIANSLVSAIPGANGNGTLATVSFTALAASDTALNLFNFLLLDSQLSGIPSSSLGGRVTVVDNPSPVPEPSTLILVGIGLGLAGVRRMRRNTQRGLAD